MTRLTMLGEPGFLLDPKVKVLRKGLAGAYCYKRVQVSGDERFKDTPDKNEYSHVADALQYCLIGGGAGDSVRYRMNQPLPERDLSSFLLGSSSHVFGRPHGPPSAYRSRAR